MTKKNNKLEKEKKPLYPIGMDYYCPHCRKEMYAPAVSELLEKGGICPWCNNPIDKGETFIWHSLNKEILACDMTTQHISNCIHLLKHRVKNIPLSKHIKDATTESINLFNKETKRRKEKILPYKEYYSKDIEDRLWGRISEEENDY